MTLTSRSPWGTSCLTLKSCFAFYKLSEHLIRGPPPSSPQNLCHFSFRHSFLCIFSWRWHRLEWLLWWQKVTAERWVSIKNAVRGAGVQAEGGVSRQAGSKSKENASYKTSELVARCSGARSQCSEGGTRKSDPPCPSASCSMGIPGPDDS